MHLLSSLMAASALGWGVAAQSNSTASDPWKLPYIPDHEKPRVFVLTDILNEPDDQQSVVRYLLYSNEFDTRGLCATTSTWLRETTHPENIEHIIEAYGEVVDNLNAHVHPLNQYQSTEKLLSLVTSGPAVYGRDALSEPISEGALRLVDRLRESVSPLWVLVWGGSNTLAQALQYMNETYSASEFAILRSRIRVYAISDQDNTGDWIRLNWPDIFYIVSIHAFSNYAVAQWRGMWEGLLHLSENKVSPDWISENIQIGPLGDAYPDRPFGAEGDSPSFLYLIQNGLGVPENPTLGSWGGRWAPINEGLTRFGDALDTYYLGEGNDTEINPQVAVARWRDHFQNDMAQRIQWTLNSDFAGATHPSVPTVNGTVGPAPLRLSVVPGSQITLDASMTYDPDHPSDSSQLQFEWYQYRESDYLVRTRQDDNYVLGLEGAGNGAETPDIWDANAEGFRRFVGGDQVRVTIPDQEEPYEYHLILQVTSHADTELPTRRYRRVMLLASQDDINADECCSAMVVPAPKEVTW